MPTEFLVNIDVDDLQGATRFYRQALGLRVGRRFGADAVELIGGSSRLYLLAKPPGSRPFESASGGRNFERHWTPVHIDIVVNDIQAAAVRVETAGGKPEGDISSHAWGRLARFADPFGNGFCLVEFQGRGYDAITT